MRTGALETQLGMDAALARVEADEWAQRARMEIKTCIAYRIPFDAEDIRQIVGDPPGSGNALGALFKEFADAGLIEIVGTRKATRPDAHGRRLMVWKGAVV